MTLVPLSPLDHVFATDVFDPMQVALLYDAALDVSKLKDSFAETARTFVGMNAVLAPLDESTLGFDLSAEAAEVVVTSAASDAPLHSCVRPVKTALGAPLARLTITQLEGGKTALTLSLSHAVSDGYGYFLFLGSWAARMRGVLVPPPITQRNPIAVSDDFDGVIPADKFTISGFVVDDEGQPERAPRVWHERSLPLSTLEQAPPSGSERISASDHLCASLWKQAVAGWTTPELTFSYALDLRKQRPTLGPLYFGNASLFAVARYTSAAFAVANELALARSIRSSVNALPSRIEQAVSELDAMRRRHGLAFLRRLRGTHPDYGFTISNLARVPFAALDFGSGAPVAMDVPSLPPPRDRVCGIMAARDHLRVLMAT